MVIIFIHKVRSLLIQWIVRLYPNTVDSEIAQLSHPSFPDLTESTQTNEYTQTMSTLRPWLHSDQVLLVVGTEFHHRDPLRRFPFCLLTARLTGPAAVQETGVPTTPAPSPESQILWGLVQSVGLLEHLHLYSLFFVNWYFWIKNRNLCRNLRWFHFKSFLQTVNNPKYIVNVYDLNRYTLLVKLFQILIILL